MMQRSFNRRETRPERPLHLLLWRCAELIFFITLHGLELLFRLAIRVSTGRGRTPLSLCGACLTGLFESLGATYIKVGQILSSRPDLLPPDIVMALSRLQDQVASFDGRNIPRLIEEAFGRRLEEIFESFDLVPISSASVAQVHRARLRQGPPVAVKIRRPGLVVKVRTDLLMLEFFARTLNRIPAMRFIPLTGLVAEFSQSIEEQLDFNLEAENCRRFYRNFEQARGIKIPKLFDDLCVESVLTMEYLDGLLKVGELDFSRRQYEMVAATSLRAFYQMVFVDGFVHCDMHPGNVFFRDDGQFVILDMGLVARLDDTTLNNFLEFFFGMVTNNGQKCARIIYETATFRAKDCDREKFEAAVAAVVNEYATRKARDFEVTGFATQLFNTQRRFGIRGATDFTMTILSLVVFEGIVKQIDPELDFQDEARRFILKAKYGIIPPRPLVPPHPG